MRICSTCGCAENPRGKLKFLTMHGSDYCERCNPFEEADGSEPVKYVVIPCPDCRGTGKSNPTGPCKSCVRYGYVRVKESALPIYIIGKL